MKICEVCKTLGINLDTLRYYEKIGLIPKIKRSDKGHRLYSKENLEHIKFIKCMRAAGIPIVLLLKYAKICNNNATSLIQKKQMLVEQKKLLKESLEKKQKSLNFANKTIKLYNSKLKKLPLNI